MFMIRTRLIRLNFYDRSTPRNTNCFHVRFKPFVFVKDVSELAMFTSIAVYMWPESLYLLSYNCGFPSLYLPFTAKYVHTKHVDISLLKY